MGIQIKDTVDNECVVFIPWECELSEVHTDGYELSISLSHNALLALKAAIKMQEDYWDSQNPD